MVLDMWERILSDLLLKEEKPILFRVTTWAKYRLKDGSIGKCRYSGTISWDMTGLADYVLSNAIQRTLWLLIADKIYPVCITAITREEYDRMKDDNAND